MPYYALMRYSSSFLFWKSEHIGKMPLSAKNEGEAIQEAEALVKSANEHKRRSGMKLELIRVSSG